MNRSLVMSAFLAWMLFCLIGTWAHADRPISASIPLLPDAVDSFGATEHGDWLYVYSGHQGNQDDQSAENLSPRFVRCEIRKPETWEELPLDRPLQDLALVGCGEHLYRIGGLGAHGQEGQTSLISTNEFSCFDPITHQWKELAALPAPRSAHDAIAADGKIYVIGGWQQIGQHIEDWHDSALVYDTTKGEQAKWRSLPIPSFRRRNLAVTAWQNCIWAIGGKDDLGEATRTVYCYDPQRGYWSEGPELPMRPEGLQGFGAAAWGLDSGLYVSGADGVLYRLRDMYGDWERVAKLRVQRFCHRLLPDGETALLAVAGYSVSFGQTRSVERIKVYAP